MFNCIRGAACWQLPFSSMKLNSYTVPAKVSEGGAKTRSPDWNDTPVTFSTVPEWAIVRPVKLFEEGVAVPARFLIVILGWKAPRINGTLRRRLTEISFGCDGQGVLWAILTTSITGA